MNCLRVFYSIQRQNKNRITGEISDVERGRKRKYSSETFERAYSVVGSVPVRLLNVKSLTKDPN
jgi:hypothetical protein